ncbi:MAG: dihydropteroate synthase [Gammaproteobacteria bacterium]
MSSGRKRIYLGLGSNLGDRRANLASAICRMRAEGLSNVRLSPVVETPALLPKGAASDWNLPFLNMVVEGEVSCSPYEWLDATKTIQDELGRKPASRWAPRTMDIDLLDWNAERLHSESLTLPHAQLTERAFVLAPLMHLNPGLEIAGCSGQTVTTLYRKLGESIPLWMGILNITPDSFSDGGIHAEIEAIPGSVERMTAAGVHIIDIGCESTRPGAQPIAPEEEWRRMEPVLRRLNERFDGELLRPLISVDTRNAGTARRALEAGADWINDVGGLTSPDMIELAREVDNDWVAMHALDVPVDPTRRLSDDCDPCDEVEGWLLRQLERWDAAGIERERLLFDPGIGFGKSSLHSLELLRHAPRFQRHGLRLVVGHSRKSFMRAFADTPTAERDLETIGASLKLCEKGVDVLRVHNVEAHVRAYTAWSHLEPYD